MAVTATGPVALPLENLRTLLANSSNFQTWVSAADADAAKAHIYRVAVDAPYAAKRPFACVRHFNPAENEHESVSGGAGNTFVERGALELYFEAAVASGHQASHADAELQFLNDVGSFLSDMDALSGTDGYLNMTGWSFLAGPQRASEDESQSEGDYMQCLLRIEWSI